MSDLKPCPCGSGSTYDDCCRPRHLGARPAETAEALMRSRYAAFAEGEIPYLVKTLHPDKRRLDTPAELAEGADRIRWTGLRVLDALAGGPVDDEGLVEFVAFFEKDGRKGQLHERSRFLRKQGSWLYVDAVPTARPKPRRGDVCWCGSGRRYRMCHG